MAEAAPAGHDDVLVSDDELSAWREIERDLKKVGRGNCQGCGCRKDEHAWYDGGQYCQACGSCTVYIEPRRRNHPCRCGCLRDVHEHYNHMDYCGRCGHEACPRYRRVRRNWLARLRRSKSK